MSCSFAEASDYFLPLSFTCQSYKLQLLMTSVGFLLSDQLVWNLISFGRRPGVVFL